MILKTPGIIEKKPGRSVRKIHSRKNEQSHFSGYQNKPQNNNIKKPLNNSKIQLAFKGFNFVRGAKSLLGKTEIQHADELLKEVTKFINPEKNVGLCSLNSFIKDKNLQNIGINVEKTLGKSFVDAIKVLPTAIIRGVKGITGGRGEIKLEKTINKRKNELLGYFLEVQKHKKHFNKVFTGENLKQLQKILKNGNQEKLKIFLKNNKLNSELILGKNSINFEKLKENLLSGNIDELRKKHINGAITSKEFGKTGSFIPSFSSDHAKLVHRFSSGGTTALFIGNDFYNLHMFISGDKKGAKKERNKRYRQQASYIGTTLYLDNVINATFRRLSNKSLPFAIALGFINSSAANIISRVINKIPLLSVKSKDVDKKPYVINATSLKENFTINSSENFYKNSKTYNNYKKLNNELAFSGWNILKPVKKGIQKFNEKAIKALPAKMSYEEFAEGYKTLKKIDSERGDEILKIAGKFMGHLKEVPENVKDIKLSDIEKAAEINGGKVIIGRNYGYRFGKSLINTVTFPFELLINLGKYITNLGLKAIGKDQIKKTSKDRFSPEVAVKNLVKWTKKAKEKADFTRKVEKASSNEIHNIKIHYGENFSGFHGPNVMEYGNDQLSTGMKLTGFTTVPFLAMDAYNKSIEEAKNQNISSEKAKQRVVQDSTRQVVSFWAVKSFNDIFKDLANHSLGGAGLAVVLNCFGYEALTRLAVGQPISPKSHEEMKDIEKKRFKNQGFASKIFGRKVKIDNEKISLGSKRLRGYPLNEHSINFATSIRKKSIKFEEFEKNLTPISFVYTGTS